MLPEKRRAGRAIRKARREAMWNEEIVALAAFPIIANAMVKAMEQLRQGFLAFGVAIVATLATPEERLAVAQRLAATVLPAVEAGSHDPSQVRVTRGTGDSVPSESKEQFHA
jgi:hypothetical protein